ncbi:DUF2782 domain-containing protein [Oleiagrimonas sp.]|jgi:hypothetical protein|uniref:DUF2782 domain-containing protein n=1 Tax=Oleiagrimonas sp. TaxID=2010330 RepID=UPI0026018D30|nr:DUF2782 domain-containing protein [Oleiagrimonas sp.]MDA3914283.1 DUF2782 domain-containing protein [Oleiagrimonas sp.]
MTRSRALPLLVLAGLFLTAQVTAQDAKGFAPLPPPPGLDAAGVKSPPAPISTVPAPAASADAAVHPAPLPQATRDALGEPPPTVAVRKVGQNTVQEYRINGRLYMIHVVPEHGLPQTYMADPEGRLERNHGQPKLGPVFYTIYHWDNPPKKSDASGQ